MSANHTMPSSVRAAVNRNAHRIATTVAYAVLADELRARAAELLESRGDVNDVVRQLDAMDIDYGPRRRLETS